jgi:hypothetical protein
MPLSSKSRTPVFQAENAIARFAGGTILITGVEIRYFVETAIRWFESNPPDQYNAGGSRVGTGGSQ